MNPVGEGATAADYLDFGERQAADSACLTAWAMGVAGDPEVLALLEQLPPAKRQPNLVFAAARWHGASTGGYDALRAVLLSRWDDVRATVLARSTQTNEVGRCATLLPVLATLPGPLALIDVGASAGLCLYPDRYSYRYTGPGTGSSTGAVLALDPEDGPSPVILPCVVEGDVPLPAGLPEVAWRGGVDLSPLDVGDDDAMAWLETLVWPEAADRRCRLRAAVGVVRDDPPSLLRGDLLEEVAGLVDRVPAGLTAVVLHSAVLAYLDAGQRARFVAEVGCLDAHWVSNEGPRVVPLDVPPAPVSDTLGTTPFVLALDGRPVAWTHGHGRAMAWL